MILQYIVSQHLFFFFFYIINLLLLIYPNFPIILTGEWEYFLFKNLL